MTDRYTAAHAAWLETVRDAAEKATDAHQWAAALFVHGTWIPGPFRYVTATGKWLAYDGTVVPAGVVSARRLAGPDLKAWTDALDAEPADDCETCGIEVDPDEADSFVVKDDNGHPTGYWCHIHESVVPIVQDAGGTWFVSEHDERGRELAPA